MNSYTVAYSVVTGPIRSYSDPDPDLDPIWSMDPERPVKVFLKSDQEVKTLGLDPAPELNPFSATAWIRILIQKKYLYPNPDLVLYLW
jgi:hypothetical protein